MTIRQMIAKLRRYPQDLEVVICVDTAKDSLFGDPGEVTVERDRKYEIDGDEDEETETQDVAIISGWASNSSYRGE